MRPLLPLFIIIHLSLIIVPAQAQPWLLRQYTQREAALQVGDSAPRMVGIPGLATEPSRMAPGAVTYRFALPRPQKSGAFPTLATVTLKGARFNPQLTANDVTYQGEGGMAPLHFTFPAPYQKGQKEMEVAIRLDSLNGITDTNASYIPKADQWRSNISSHLWDDVVVRLHGPVYLDRIVPRWVPDSGFVRVDVQAIGSSTGLKDIRLRGRLIDVEGNVAGEGAIMYTASTDPRIIIPVKYPRLWTPELPNRYHLVLTMESNLGLVDSVSFAYGLKTFGTKGLGFVLNGKPWKARGATVVWHRWVRDKEGRELAWDTAWFVKNVIRPLKERGANLLRFHLGVPPEVYLDLCDKYGLAVQYEWSFFHGLPARPGSMERQWRSWLDVAARHPSVCLIHPWNETDDGPQSKAAFAVMEKLEREYGHLSIAGRDQIHVHKYWWSLFENLGLYYDSAAQFGKPVMADEFGGNYLDGEGNPGGYRTLKESWLRTLGQGQNARERMNHQAAASGKVADYWRRLGVAGYSPFCILGSWEDGNHWYKGALKKDKPALLKPVWEAMRPAWSAVSVSLNCWDRHALMGAVMRVPVTLYNDSDTAVEIRCETGVERDTLYRDPWMGNPSVAFFPPEGPDFTKRLQPLTRFDTVVIIRLPNRLRQNHIMATANYRHGGKDKRVVSDWLVETYAKPKLKTKSPAHAFPVNSPLGAAFASHGLKANATQTKRDHWILTGEMFKTTNLAALEAHLMGGGSILIIEVGPRWQGIENEHPERANLQGSTQIKEPRTQVLNLPFGVEGRFTELAEPETHFHAISGYKSGDRGLWNGYRGGITVPAAKMELRGLSQAGVMAYWRQCNAPVESLEMGKSLFAYQLQGYYAYSTMENDADTIRRLQAKVKFLLDDAPSLAANINPNARVERIDVLKEYQNAKGGQAAAIQPLAKCGVGLNRVPVYEIDYGKGRGNLIICQLFTEGRLDPKNQPTELYAPRYDPVAVYYVQSLLEELAR